ncbi:unnamed protein product [Zymoseptoria tritici ST99CH_1A5]|uniref:ABC1 atypical kinase-like domain-containing protein n=1 Tax=Zymoseptoria tritici ST99CH_1A5 TaxID=1276529 RepID=A0A1Y6M065_ZYMTR|nr:unnamed protein product [Zymoseptoria tritici ST99CH_1A5]
MLRNISPVCWRCASRTLTSPPTTTTLRTISTSSQQTTSLLTRPVRPLNSIIRRHASQFQPLAPPSPASLGKPTTAKTYRRSRKWLRRLIRLSLASGLIYLLDTNFYDSSFTRSVRTFGTGLLIALDYKLNFRADPWIGESVQDLHARSATRVFNLLRENGGLYLKIGQALAMQTAIMPPEFGKMFERMFDDATQNSWKDVEKVIREDFGKSPEEVFGISFDGDPNKGIMERTARASASVAQVHWARLPDGREVAIKIQKKEIARQVGWDLWAFKVVSKIYSWWFDLPLYHLVPYVCDRLMAETDFEFEASNSRKMRALIANEPRLRDRVYIPDVYPELSSKRVMTAEWIEGIRLWDKDGIANTWQVGWRQGSPGAGGVQLPPPPASAHASVTTNDPLNEKLKPTRDAWRGADGKGGLGLSLKPVMQTMVDLFSAQMFLWGLVHCDPHPGNIFIRRKPNGKPELVLIDHGLYIQMKPKFRREYALFWRSLMTFDNATIARITHDEWGVDAPDMFASATLLRPYEGGDHSVSKRIKEVSQKPERERQFEMQQHMRKSIRDMLANQDKFPQELIFIGRNLRIVQGNNQYLGSPVNRIKITGYWASRALVDDSHDLTVTERWREYGRHLLFRCVLAGTDLWFWWAKARQIVGWGKGMDDDLEESMKKMMSGMGVELQHSVFEG